MCNFYFAVTGHLCYLSIVIGAEVDKDIRAQKNILRAAGMVSYFASISSAALVALKSS